MGDRFVLITVAEIPTATAASSKTAVSFFCPERSKGSTVCKFRHLRTIEKKPNNAIYWSPRGRFVVLATAQSRHGHDLDFWDLDFGGEKVDKDLTANLQLMATVENYGVTDIEWDPSGRYLVSSASIWKYSVSSLISYPPMWLSNDLTPT